MTNLWNTGDIITADKLNVTGNIFWVTVTFVEYGEGEDERIWSTDKTAAEILVAYNEGKLPVVKRVAAEGMTIDDGAPLVAYPTDIFMMQTVISQMPISTLLFTIAKQI